MDLNPVRGCRLGEPVVLKAGSTLFLRVRLGALILLAVYVFALAIAMAKGGGDEVLLLLGFFSVMAILAVAVLAIDFHRTWIAERAYNVLRQELVTRWGSGEVEFIKTVVARRVRFTVYMVGGASSRYPYSVHHIEAEGAYLRRKIHRLKGYESYGVVIDKQFRGGLSLAGLELREPGIEGSIILYIPNKPPHIHGQKHVIQAPWGARVTIEVDHAEGFKGRARLEGEGEAVIYLEARCSIAPKSVKPLKMKLARLKSGRENIIEAKLHPEKPVYIIATKKHNLKGIAANLPRPIAVGTLPTYNLIVELRKGIFRKHKEKIIINPGARVPRVNGA